MKADWADPLLQETIASLNDPRIWHMALLVDQMHHWWRSALALGASRAEVEAAIANHALACAFYAATAQSA